MNRQNWTKQEDKILREIVESNGSDDWTKNSEIFHKVSNCTTTTTTTTKKRSGKQCRQRWYNHLDPNILKTQWNEQEENQLFLMHKIYGNKWKELTKYFPGRTDNDIKNHFYSTLRRSLRRLNKFIGEKNSTNQMRQIKPSVLTFIINRIYSSQAINHSPKTDETLINSLKELPELIFKFSSFKPVKNNMEKKVDESVRDRIIQILSLVRQFKKMYNHNKNNQKHQPQQKRRKNMTIQHKNKEESENKEIGATNHCEDGEDKSKQVTFYIIKSGEIDREPHSPMNSHECSEHQPYISLAPTIPPPKSISSLSRKVLVISRTEQLPQHLKADQDWSSTKHFQFLDERIDNQLMSIEQPSMELSQNSNFFSNLVVIGRHIQPQEYQGELLIQDEAQIDQILYENYQN